MKQEPTIKAEKEQRSTKGMCGGEDRSPPPGHQSHTQQAKLSRRRTKKDPSIRRRTRPPSPNSTPTIPKSHPSFHLLNYHSPNTPPPVTHGARTRTHTAEIIGNFAFLSIETGHLLPR